MKCGCCGFECANDAPSLMAVDIDIGVTSGGSTIRDICFFCQIARERWGYHHTLSPEVLHHNACMNVLFTALAPVKPAGQKEQVDDR